MHGHIICTENSPVCCCCCLNSSRHKFKKCTTGTIWGHHQSHDKTTRWYFYCNSNQTDLRTVWYSTSISMPSPRETILRSMFTLTFLALLATKPSLLLLLILIRPHFCASHAYLYPADKRVKPWVKTSKVWTVKAKAALQVLSAQTGICL